MPVMKRSDLMNYKVTDGNEPCCWCHSPVTGAPVLIKGKNYCLWCIFAFCRDLLVLPRATKIRATRIKDAATLTEFIKS